MVQRLCILLVLFFLAGCTATKTFIKTTSSLDESIAVSTLSPQIHDVRIYKQDSFFYVSGTVNKPLNKDLTRTKVVTRFMDSGGNVVTESREKIIPRRTHTQRAVEGRFVARTPFNQAVKSCSVAVEWNE